MSAMRLSPQVLLLILDYFLYGTVIGARSPGNPNHQTRFVALHELVC